jgi:hypothetical protein
MAGQRMSGTCGAVYVVLGERPDLDRLERCPAQPAWDREAGLLDHCATHMAQLDWVRSNPARLAAYNLLAAQVDLGGLLPATQESLL